MLNALTEGTIIATVNDGWYTTIPTTDNTSTYITPSNYGNTLTISPLGSLSNPADFLTVTFRGNTPRVVRTYDGGASLNVKGKSIRLM